VFSARRMAPTLIARIVMYPSNEIIMFLLAVYNFQFWSKAFGLHCISYEKYVIDTVADLGGRAV
jgi:hypothetical protein